jgi:hypothetical protein
MEPSVADVASAAIVFAVFLSLMRDVVHARPGAGRSRPPPPTPPMASVCALAATMLKYRHTESATMPDELAEAIAKTSVEAELVVADAAATPAALVAHQLLWLSTATEVSAAIPPATRRPMMQLVYYAVYQSGAMAGVREPALAHAGINGMLHELRATMRLLAMTAPDADADVTERLRAALRELLLDVPLTAAERAAVSETQARMVRATGVIGAMLLAA